MADATINMAVCATMHRINLPRAVAALEVAVAVAVVGEAGIPYPKHDKLRVCSNVNRERERELQLQFGVGVAGTCVVPISEWQQ